MRSEISESKSDIKSILKEITWMKESNIELKTTSNSLHDTISRCPVCNGKINIEELNIKANRALTIATISITLNLATLALIGTHILK